MPAAITARRVLLADGEWHDTTLQIEDGRIAAIGGPAQPGTVDAGDYLVLPGIVDLHGDAFERQILPRPEAAFPLAMAMLDTDRQLVANGITTAYHGVTWSWEGGLRGRDNAVGIRRILNQLKAKLAAEHRIHLRWETFNLDAEAELADWIASGHVHLLAFNDHLDMVVARLNDDGKLRKYAERAGQSLANFRALVERTAAREAEVPAAIARLAAVARGAGVPMASHDDDTVAEREAFHAIGCSISEFPRTSEATEAAHRLQSPIVFGAPNVVRGGSHCGAPTAADMVAAERCDVLASDYYYPAPLAAACHLVRDGICGWARAAALIARNPARAAGLTDRGELAVGQRADLIVVDASDLTTPRVIATVVGGRLVHQAEELARIAA
ncbi:alpha-D-ribose 1-methylphosphonate 5-triphosphate diphosphatase [Chitinolyticbacter meiyuanensis]|uniref:alpha-D-ribose 1-methylphosphonate 5-triphosphate diphosphatase n=1 Tax=Chitinolyticbacter meiyuanensis TaxID=682798 RepID=UPI0011E59C77|nr:alpha-D-ribose 1-methylphosphonate 5-triphosphate diphosphatase [Chitinolyticbacter meiyuanensis]